MTREYENWKNRSTNKNEQLLKIQHYIKVRLLHDRQQLLPNTKHHWRKAAASVENLQIPVLEFI